MSVYAKLNRVLHYRLLEEQHTNLQPYIATFEKERKIPFPSLWNLEMQNEKDKVELLKKEVASIEPTYQSARAHLAELMASYQPFSHAYLISKEITEESKDARHNLSTAREVVQAQMNLMGELKYLEEKSAYLAKESANMTIPIPPFIRPFHWEEDAAGGAQANKYLPWWQLTRLNRKDLVAALLFGIRISFVVGLSAVGLALFIGGALGMISGFFAGKADLFICRLIEIWEAMPTFFMFSYCRNHTDEIALSNHCSAWFVWLDKFCTLYACRGFKAAQSSLCNGFPIPWLPQSLILCFQDLTQCHCSPSNLTPFRNDGSYYK